MRPSVHIAYACCAFLLSAFVFAKVGQEGLAMGLIVAALVTSPGALALRLFEWWVERNEKGGDVDDSEKGV